MPRNGAGTYSVPNSFTAGQTISSDDVDENFSDAGAALTASLPRNGEAGMDSGAQIKADAGSAAAPGYAFGSDPNTGAYSAGADEYAICTGGTKRVGVTDKGVRQESPVLAIMMPVGMVFDYAGASAPEYSILCYGQAISRTTYAGLFTAIGETYGVGDGSTTFNVPDCRGRVAAGQDDMGGTSANRLTNQTGGLDGDTLGATGGAETHTLTTAQLAAHTHDDGTYVADSSGAHQHFAANGESSTTQLSSSNTIVEQGNHGNANSYILGGDGTAANRGLTSSGGAHTHGVSGSSGSSGSGSAHNNVQPTIIMNKCIVTGVAN